jgi:hypothetical protein
MLTRRAFHAQCTPRSPAKRQCPSASSPVRKRASRSPAPQYRLSHTVDMRLPRSTRHPDRQLAANFCLSILTI